MARAGRDASLPGHCDRNWSRALAAGDRAVVGHLRTAGPAAGKPSIAVLPFGSLSDNAQQDYFADGLTDDLITDLSKISGLMVIARNSAFAFKDQPKNVRQVAEQLGVRYVLEGNVRRAGDKIRVNVQLIDATTASNVWAERYEGDYAKIFELQDQMIRRIVEALSVRLTESETSADCSPADPQSRSLRFLYPSRTEGLCGRFQISRRALSLYEKAISLDPEFADAYAGYARAIVDVLSFDFQPVMLSAVARQRAYEAAGRALELNPQAAASLCRPRHPADAGRRDRQGHRVGRTGSGARSERRGRQAQPRHRADLCGAEPGSAGGHGTSAATRSQAESAGLRLLWPRALHEPPIRRGAQGPSLRRP